MTFIKRFKPLSAMPLLSAVVSPAAFAHPGHETANMLHGILHTEHLLILLAIGVVVAIRLFIKE